MAKVRRHRRPENATEVRRLRLCKGKRFNSGSLQPAIHMIALAIR